MMRIRVSLISRPVVLALSLVTALAAALLCPRPAESRPAACGGTVEAVPGTQSGFSRDFNPVFLKGLKVSPANPLRFEFVIDPGDTDLNDEEFAAETAKIVEYFFAALHIPADDVWVNLSPYDYQGAMPPDLTRTRLGTDLLAQDLLLKKLAASTVFPLDDLGREFWLQVSHRAQQEFGSLDLPVNLFSRIWIVPEVASVHVEGGAAYVVGTRLKVVLEDDLEGRAWHARVRGFRAARQSSPVDEMIHDIMRDFVLPQIEEEVNFGENFAELRQIYHTLILAQWYKRQLRALSLQEVDLDQLENGDFFGKQAADRIYHGYLRYLEKASGGQGVAVGEGGAAVTAYFSGGVQFGRALTEVYREVDAPNILEVIHRQGLAGKPRSSHQ